MTPFQVYTKYYNIMQQAYASYLANLMSLWDGKYPLQYSIHARAFESTTNNNLLFGPCIYDFMNELHSSHDATSVLEYNTVRHIILNSQTVTYPINLVVDIRNTPTPVIFLVEEYNKFLINLACIGSSTIILYGNPNTSTIYHAFPDPGYTEFYRSIVESE